jgi:site-specific DNA recombinase
MGACIGYVRVSSEKQKDFGVSLEAQTEKIRAMAVVHGVELEVIVDAAESAKSLDRLGMERLLSLVDAGKVEKMFVSKLDRVTRSVRDLAELLERFNRRGVSLVSVAESLDTASAGGRLVPNLLCSVSQWEREAIGERTGTAIQYKKSVGERVGTITYGFQLSSDNKHLEPNPAEQAIVALIRRMRKAGRTLRAIATELNKRNLTTRRGSAWHHVYVNGILRNAKV